MIRSIKNITILIGSILVILFSRSFPEWWWYSYFSVLVLLCILYGIAVIKRTKGQNMKSLAELKNEIEDKGYRYHIEFVPRSATWYAQVWRDEWAIKEFYRDEDKARALEQAFRLAEKRHEEERK